MARATLPVPSEKAVQAQGVALMRSIGGKVYIIGHPSPNDGRRHRGTGQTAGISDVVAFLPPRPVRAVFEPGAVMHVKVLGLWWEAKRPGGRLRPEQVLFRQLCLDAEWAHVAGDLDALIAFLVERHYLKPENLPHYRQPPQIGVATS